MVPIKRVGGSHSFPYTSPSGVSGGSAGRAPIVKRFVTIDEGHPHMELSPVPRRREHSPPRWALLAVLIITPVTLLAALPAVLGLERYVLTAQDMGAAHGRGAIALEREVPSDDVRVGDVISYRPPADAGIQGLVTRRVVEVGPGYLQTQIDQTATADPWLVRTVETPTVSRVALSIPWVGYPMLSDSGRGPWVLVIVLAGLVLAGAVVRDVRHVKHLPTASSPSIGHTRV